jgi:hypothetical protein
MHPLTSTTRLLIYLSLALLPFENAFPNKLQEIIETYSLSSKPNQYMT